ncbi:unnamed protein product [Echinostoma caproni]|uniref:Coiled-coil domain-containing protein 176 n=1 Tax=Echinostoma caproni TaxID=27848 RepID=A0A183ALU8_9TREM|nr:unnamed protein product [Echinostoma caproni]
MTQCSETLSQEAELNAKKVLVAKLEQEIHELKAKLTKTGVEYNELTEKYNTLKTQCETKSVEKEKVDKHVSEISQVLKTEQEKTKSLEDRIKNQAVERERAEHEMRKAEERLEYFVTQMIRIFDKYVSESELSAGGWKDETKISQLIAHASQLAEENAKHRGEIQSLTERVRQRDLQLAERDRTVDRLGSQITRTTECDRETRNLAQAKLNLTPDKTTRLFTEEIRARLVQFNVHICELRMFVRWAVKKAWTGEMGKITETGTTVYSYGISVN